MDKILVVVFDDEKTAYQGRAALADLHNEGSLTVYASAVIAKDKKGAVTVKQEADQGPIVTIAGLATGSLIGILSGPIGLAAGAMGGAWLGSLFDLAELGVGEDFLNEVSEKLTPGKSAVVAEIDEEWVMPLETRMEEIGGTVFRRARGEFIHAQIEREIAVNKAEIEKLKTEFNRTTGDAKAKMQVKLDAARKRLQARRDQLSNHLKAIQRDSQAKIESMQKQASKAKGDLKAEIEKRVEKARKEDEDLVRKMENVFRHVKEVANA